MGFAVADAAARLGHDVILITGPVHLETPHLVTRINIETAADMYEAVTKNLVGCEVAIHSAAVADYRPTQAHAQKLKKTATPLTLSLERTPDILGSMRDPLGFSGYLIGFAAETENLIENALGKLKRKKCDLLVANDVSRNDIGFDQRDNEVTLIFRDGRQELIAKSAKARIGEVIMQHLEAELSQQES